MLQLYILSITTTVHPIEPLSPKKQNDLLQIYISKIDIRTVLVLIIKASHKLFC